MRRPSKGPILVVDDDEDVREALRDTLEDEGYEVVLSDGGESALRFLQEGRCPCLVLLDLMMPHMDGNQFQQELKKHPETANIPVVLLTADVHAKARLTGVGPNQALQKPVELDDLLAVVQAHCGNT